MTSEKAINEILDNIDFNRIQKTMDALDWFYGVDKQAPSLGKLYRTAKRCLDAVVCGEADMLGTGGFLATRKVAADGKVELGLYFSITDWGSTYDDNKM